MLCSNKRFLDLGFVLLYKYQRRKGIRGYVGSGSGRRNHQQKESLPRVIGWERADEKENMTGQGYIVNKYGE